MTHPKRLPLSTDVREGAPTTRAQLDTENPCACGDLIDAQGCCPTCEPCPHTNLDHGVCLDCEADLTEHISARAYDSAKARRQDGP